MSTREAQNDRNEVPETVPGRRNQGEADIE